MSSEFTVGQLIAALLVGSVVYVLFLDFITRRKKKRKTDFVYNKPAMQGLARSHLVGLMGSMVPPSAFRLNRDEIGALPDDDVRNRSTSIIDLVKGLFRKINPFNKTKYKN